MPTGTVITATLSELKGAASPLTEDVYYLRDSGMEGEFYFDDTDSSSPEDLKMVITHTATGNKFKRIVEQSRKRVVSIDQLKNSNVSFIANPQSSDIFYINDHGKQGDFYYDSGALSTTVGDDAITITRGTGPDFKVFRRIITDGVLNAKWFEPSGSYSDAQPFLQKAIDTAITSFIKKIYIPKGEYTLRKGLLLRGPVNQFLESIELFGEGRVYGGGPEQTHLFIDNAESFGIGLHKCKGARVSNIYLRGKNEHLDALNLYDVLENPDTEWAQGCRNNVTSPHAGIVIDPFVNSASWPTEEQYPDFTDQYIDEPGGGSTDIIIDNCRTRLFVVGVCFTPHEYPQNGDAMAVNNCRIDYCKAGISIGQSQNRSIYVNNLKCWGATETLFDCYNYSDGRADNPEVDGLQIAGGVRYLSRLSGYANKGLIIRRMHAELLYSLGGNFDGLSGDLIIENSWVNFSACYPLNELGAYVIHNALTIFKGHVLKVVDSYFGKYAGAAATPVQCNAAQVIFEKCQLDFLVANKTIGRVTYKNCHGPSNFAFGDNEILFGNYPPEIGSLGILFTSNMEWHMDRSVFSLPAQTTYSYKRTKLHRTTLGYAVRKDVFTFYIEEISLTNIDEDNLTADFVLTAGSEKYKLIKLGDHLYSSYGVDEFGDTGDFFLGRVTAKNDSTGVITLGVTSKGIDNVTAYPITIYRHDYLIPPLILGDCELGSNVLTNCIAEQNADVAVTMPGITITSPHFPKGTYIVSCTSTTVTLSNEALATKEKIELVGADWVATEYGIVDIGNSPVTGYKRGDIIFNTDFVRFPYVQKWVCSRSGIGALYPPQFDIVFNECRQVLTGNGSIAIDGGRMVRDLVVQSTSATSSLDIGTTPGGNDIALGLSLIGGIDKVVNVGVYFRNAGAIYLTGITSDTEVIIE